MKTNQNRKRDLLNLLYGILIIFLLNVIGSYVFDRFDLTTEKRYTLSKPTKDLLKNLDDVVYVKVYLEGEFPAGYKRLRNSTKEMLDEFRALSGDNIQYEFINPSADPDDKVKRRIYEQLTKQGLQYSNIRVKEKDGKSEKVIFPGAIITYKGREAPLQLLKGEIGSHSEEMLNSSIQHLEYEIANTIRKLNINTKQKIAFIEGHGELNELDVKDITYSLKEYYEVDRVRINGNHKAINGYSTIIIAKPDSTFSDEDKVIIDQFLMKGGKILWLIDGVKASMDSLQSSITMGLAHNVNIEDQLFKYGVRINNNLVMDMQASPIEIIIGYIGNQPQKEIFPWFYSPILIPTSSHTIVNNLNGVSAEFISTIDTVGSASLKKTFLLHSSKYTKVVNAPTRISINMLRDEPDFRQFNKPYSPLAVLVEGEFESVFKNRPIAKMLTSIKEIGFKEKSKPTKMIVIADGDMIKNKIHKATGNIYPLGYDRILNEVFDNKTFILNAINYLCDDSGLISARSRELKLRLLDTKRIEKEKLHWQMINMVVPIVLIILFGVIQFFIRKRRFAS